MARVAVSSLCVLVASSVLGAGTAGAATFTGTNAASLVPPDNGPSSTSTIAASGLGAVTSASITLHGVTHSNAQDLDVLLVSPGGVKSLLMSDACAGIVNSLNLTLIDSAPAPIPAAACASTSYRPQDYVGNVVCEPDGADVLPPPAPAGIDADNLAAFNGAPGNGNWSLYVADNCMVSTGTIAGGWSLTLNATDPPPAAPPTKKKKKCKKKKKGKAAAKKCKKKK